MQECITVSIYCPPSKGEAGIGRCAAESHSDANNTAHAGYLQSCCSRLAAMLATYTEGYIWDTDCFFINELRDAYPSPSYTGTFNVGESIDDEWFIVSLLQKMSKSFRDFFISVHDIDGEFLLIEVADLIPRHLQPENTSNRVWLHGGELHIIEDKLTVPNTDAAIRLIATNPGTTVAHASIQDRINERLRRYSIEVTSYLL